MLRHTVSLKEMVKFLMRHPFYSLAHFGTFVKRELTIFCRVDLTATVLIAESRGQTGPNFTFLLLISNLSLNIRQCTSIFSSKGKI